MATKEVAETAKTLKEGERVLAPTRRPDGTLRKPVRIRAGYVPQDEVAVYKSKGSQLKKDETVPPGYDPEDDVNAVNKPKSKSAKRNERKKEKRLQEQNEVSSTGDGNGDVEETVRSIVSGVNEMSIASVAGPESKGDHVPDIDKRIRALKKKIRLTEAQEQKTGQDLKPEQVEKIAKLANRIKAFGRSFHGIISINLFRQ